MARRNSVDDLPGEARHWLDRALAEGNFSGYERLEAYLRERGYVISKSAIHRYGQKLERRLAAIKAGTEAAKLLVDASPDGQDARSEALTAMIQTELFETLVNLQEATAGDLDPAERVKLLSAAAKNIATLTRSSVNLKRYQAEAEERGQQKLLEKQRARVEAMGGQGGITPEAMALIHEALGIRA